MTEPTPTTTPETEGGTAGSLQLVQLVHRVPRELLDDSDSLQFIIERLRRQVGHYLVDHRMEAVGSISIEVREEYLGDPEPIARSWWERLLRRPVRYTQTGEPVYALHLQLRAVPVSVTP